MAKPTAYSFTLREITEVLIREQGITSGHWQVGVSFNAVANNVSINEGETLPTMAVQVQRLNLVAVPEPTPMSVDAGALAFSQDEVPI